MVASNVPDVVNLPELSRDVRTLILDKAQQSVGLGLDRKTALLLSATFAMAPVVAAIRVSFDGQRLKRAELEKLVKDLISRIAETPAGKAVAS